MTAVLILITLTLAFLLALATVKLAASRKIRRELADKLIVEQAKHIPHMAAATKPHPHRPTKFHTAGLKSSKQKQTGQPQHD